MSGSAMRVRLVHAPGQRVAELIALGADVGRGLEFPQHRVQPLRHILGDAIEQEGRGLAAPARVACRARSRARSNSRGAAAGFGVMRGWYAGRPDFWQSGTLERRAPRR